jgi:RNA polymerase sigma-70 factor (ECF subfamily)
METDRLDSFDVLVRPQMAALFRAAYRLTGNRADAEDLVQDTCVTAYAHLLELKTCAYPLRWLMRVLFNRFIDGIRKQERGPFQSIDIAPESSVLASNAADPEALASEADGENAFYRAWLELDENQRALLSLRAEGYGLVEIAEITGIAHEVLGARLHRARKSLKRHLDNIEEAETSASRCGRLR